jgi:hypothetical protein
MSPRDLLTSESRTQRLDLDQVLGAEAPDRLTLACTAYLLLPGLMFLGGWAQTWAVLLAGGAAVVSLALSPGWRGAWPEGLRTTLLCLACGLLWAAFTGAQHWIYATADWQVRDAVLRDLASYPWPVAYDEEVVWLLRAPLGFFLPAGLVGRSAGFAASQVALWLWTGLGLALVLLLLSRLARAGKVELASLAALFLVFGGVDILPNIVLDHLYGTGPLASWGRGGEWWARAFQYPGHVTSLLWAPNHTMPAWLGALMLLRHGRTGGFAASLALPLAAGAFWSPVSTAGAALLGGIWVLQVRQLKAALLSPANWLALVFAAPICLYLIAGSGQVPHGWVFMIRPPLEAAWRWPLFLLVEVLVWAVPAAFLVRGHRFGAAVALLCLLPAYVFGPGNEAASRGSQAALAVLAVVAGIAMLQPRPSLARTALRVVAALALLGSVMEASLLVTKDPWNASTNCTVPEAARQSVFRESTDWSHYFAPWPEPTLQMWLQPPHPRPIPERSPNCWPDGSV